MKKALKKTHITLLAIMIPVLSVLSVSCRNEKNGVDEGEAEEVLTVYSGRSDSSCAIRLIAAWLMCVANAILSSKKAL